MTEREKILNRIRYKRWRNNHLEESRRRNREWMRKNSHRYKGKYKNDSLGQTVGYSRAHYLKHRERILERNRLYRINNPYIVRIHKKLYKARRRAGGSLSRKEIQIIYEENIIKNGTLTCGLCYKPIVMGEDSLDHKTPISKGGDNSLVNLWIVHKVCNFRKNDKTVEEFMKITSTEVI